MSEVENGAGACPVCGTPAHIGCECNKEPNFEEVENYQHFNKDPEKIKTRLENYENRKKTMTKYFEEDLDIFMTDNPQLDDNNTLRYMPVGSYTYCLCAMADKIRIGTQNKKGKIEFTDEKSDIDTNTQKTLALLPHDTDMVNFTGQPQAEAYDLKRYQERKKVVEEKTNLINPDFFDAKHETQRIVEYTVGDKKIIGNHPLDQFTETYIGWTTLLGVERSMGENGKARKDKVLKYENILKSLLQSYNIDEIAEKIAKYYQTINTEGKGNKIYIENSDWMLHKLLQEDGEQEYIDENQTPALITLARKVEQKVKEVEGK